jgi:hypothetical protein
MTHAPDALAVPQWRPTERDIADARVTELSWRELLRGEGSSRSSRQPRAARIVAA